MAYDYHESKLIDTIFSRTPGISRAADAASACMPCLSSDYFIETINNVIKDLGRDISDFLSDTLNR
jgi:hypothetical protein